MADPIPNTLRVWEGWLPAQATGSSPSLPVASLLPPSSLPALEVERTDMDQLYAREALGSDGPPREAAEPLTLQWFLAAENARLYRYGKWLPRLLEYAKHGGERFLGIGFGLGTDWVQYARHGAEVIACSPSPQHLEMIQRNFELRGLHARMVHAQPTKLPLEPASIDVACVSNLLHGLSDPRAFVDELYRVLKPGGKVLALTPARYNVDFWARCFFPWRYLLRPRNPIFGPGVSGFSGAGLRRLFGPFVEHRVYKRHLRRGDVPHLWRLLPLGVLERVLGRVLIIKAFKPLSAARTLQAAA